MTEVLSFVMGRSWNYMHIRSSLSTLFSVTLIIEEMAIKKFERVIEC